MDGIQQPYHPLPQHHQVPHHHHAHQQHVHHQHHGEQHIEFQDDAGHVAPQHHYAPQQIDHQQVGPGDEDAARVLAHMDQSLVAQMHAYAHQTHAQEGVPPDADTAAALAAAAAAVPGAQQPQRKASRTTSSASREAPDEDDDRRRKRRLANREAARRMRSRRQQQAVSLGEEASQLRNANQQLLERLQLVTQQHQDALQQINLLRSELMTVKQTLGAWQQGMSFPMRQMDGSGPMPMVSNGMPGGLMAVPAHLYSPAAMKPPPDEAGGGHEGAHGMHNGLPHADMQHPHADMQQQQQEHEHHHEHQDSEQISVQQQAAGNEDAVATSDPVAEGEQHTWGPGSQGASLPAQGS